jgi:hypothetical protein
MSVELLKDLAAYHFSDLFLATEVLWRDVNSQTPHRPVHLLDGLHGLLVLGEHLGIYRRQIPKLADAIRLSAWFDQQHVRDLGRCGSPRAVDDYATESQAGGFFDPPLD